MTKTFDRIAAQGDFIIIRVDAIPAETPETIVRVREVGAP